MAEPARQVKTAIQQKAWLQLANMSWLGSTIRAGLLQEFGNPLRAFTASKAELLKVKGWDHIRLERFLSTAAKTEPICTSELLEQKETRMVCFDDDEYPPLLREIPDSPPVLFIKGEISNPAAPALAIVGARNGTQMGYDLARDFAFRLAAAGFTIVSGLALGIDTHAHRGALEAEATTVAVLANGPDVIYPRGNRRIRDAILKKGAIISEYPPGVIARPWHFPVRNRIISGMCLATLVVEASARSGSLITARLAAEQNREVFALPGISGSTTSEGTLSLIEEGATLVTSPDELIEHYGELLPEKKLLEKSDDFEDLTDEEKKLLAAMASEPVSIDRLLESGWPRDRLFSLLLQLEMRDYLVKLQGNTYQTRNKHR
ncbi:MAG: DNA-protecting protein DprA [Candidatus Riflebacteria bacterium HGW-Riflebacteria-1]|jgi:DNA processing protein|nr:MAG: DNA-protecting protein DprA [Candidatus Riflebacteria bacterium HGW-Riflebacteria-1]